MITYEWWSNGFIPKNYNFPVTHKTARLTMSNNRLFGRSTDSGDVWDLRDSILELCEHEQRQETTFRSNSGLSTTIELNDSFNEERVLQWLSEDPGNGFIRIYPPDINEFSRSCLIPCSLKTSVQQICRTLGISTKVLHLQMNGDVIKRLEPQELPLSIQNDFLVSLGYTDIIRMQEEGPKEELAYLIKFYAGKPICDSGTLSNPIQGYAQVKKGGMFQQWTTRWCAIYNTRIHFYKDDTKKDSPNIFQLMGGSVERTEGKGLEFCLKITARDNDKQIFLNFCDENECLTWFKKCKKATDRLPTTADLSCCHLEYLPENVFINKDLMVLNLQHNLLKDRPSEEDVMLGWIDDLEKFCHLRSINLADNNLHLFPLSICKITSLVELNLASNKIKEVPSNIKQLENLQALHLHNNQLTNLPDEIISLKKLSILVLAFNRFTNIPTVVAQLTNIRFSEVEGVTMAGNHIERIATDVLMELKHARKLDLRLNMLTLPLTETMKFSVLEHLSHLDVRDNQISELDLRSVKTLEILCCERNGMTSLSLHGGSLKVLLASCNCLDQLVIFPKPDGLIHIDISDNCLEYLPDWLSDCHQLKKLIAHENFLRELPLRLFTNAKKLSHINLAHNHLTSLPSEIGELSLENLQIQHNYIFALPQNLLKRLTRLTVFNSSRSLLQSLPHLHENADLNRLQELHLTGNFLGNSILKIVSGYNRLKILNLAHNEISELYDEDIMNLEMLQEFNVSSNQLQSLPDALGKLKNLMVLRAHSNYLSSLPNFCNAKSLRILDVGHNKLLNISVTDLMASKLNLLDIGLNDQLKVDRLEFRNIIGKKNICLVDSSGQNRKLPGLTRKKFTNNNDIEDPSCYPWKVGFSESSGSRNKLCLQIVKFLDFNDNKDCLVGIFDGGRNSELPKLLAKNIKRIFREEINHAATKEKFMKYAFLSSHRNLRLTGQKIGVSAALCHIHKTLAGGHSSGNLNGNRSLGQMFNFILTIANVGDVEAVLCRKGEAVLLTRKFVALSDNEETQRVCKSSGIVTEDGKVNGVTPCTRLLGCAHLYPQVIPEPFCVSIPLQSDDEFVIIANSSFWKYVPYEEAVEEAYNIGSPIVASKHLQDLAECYGSKENIAVLVLRLNTEPGPTLGRLKPPHREMSIDDVEAAIQHDLEIAQRRSTQKKFIGGQHFQTLSFVKNRQFYQQSMFPVNRVFNNSNHFNNYNDIISLPSTNNINNQQYNRQSDITKVIDDSSKVKNESNSANVAPSQTKVVTFQSKDINSSQSHTSPSSNSSSSSKAIRNSYGELNSSTTTSQGSSLSSPTEGSISFTHKGYTLQTNASLIDSTQSSNSSNHDNDNFTSSHHHPSPPKRSQGFKTKVPPPRPQATKSSDEILPSPPEQTTSPNLSTTEVNDEESIDEISLPTSPPIRVEHPDDSEQFLDRLNVDGLAQSRRTSKPKIPIINSSRPHSRFIKRSSALEALNTVPSQNPQLDMYCSSDSLLCDSFSQLNPSDHLNKIMSAKEKKLSMYLASNKIGTSQIQRNAKGPSPTRNVEVSLNLQPSNISSDDIKDSEIVEIMMKKPPQPTKMKRGSIMNTIAMFESANASKPPLPPTSKSVNEHISNENNRTHRVPEVENKRFDHEPPCSPDNSKGALDPNNYQIKSTTRPLEIPINVVKVNRPPTVIRSSYAANIGALPRSCFEFSKETNSNIKIEQSKPIKSYEIAKF